MCGDDLICGICEQMILQVDLVRRRAGAGLVLGRRFYQSFIFCILKIFVNFYELRIETIITVISFKFSAFLGNVILINEVY